MNQRPEPPRQNEPRRPVRSPPDLTACSLLDAYRARPAAPVGSWVEYRSATPAEPLIIAAACGRSGPTLYRAASGLLTLAGLDPGRIWFCDVRTGSAERMDETVQGVVRAVARLEPPEPAGPARPLIAYACFGGAHASVTAAALHLGLVPDGAASAQVIARLPWFDRQSHRRLGNPVRMGTDAQGRTVAVIGLGPCSAQLGRLLERILSLASGQAEVVRVVDALRGANWAMRVGGFLSRRLGLVAIGRPIVTLGTLAHLDRLRNVVERVQALPSVHVFGSQSDPSALVDDAGRSAPSESGR